MKNKIALFTSAVGLICFACQTPKQETKQTEIMHISSDQGKKWNVFGVKIVGKILSEDTHGKYSVIVTETPSQGGPPKHVHQHEDELFYILKGNYTFYCGSKTIKATKGDFVHLPKGIPHHFKNTDTISGITMNTITPGGFENFFNDVAYYTQNKTFNKTKLDSLANNYGIKFIK